MADNVVARQQTGWLVVCDSPDICKTPMGKSNPPVPYIVIAKLDDATETAHSVRANGHPVVTYQESYVPTTIGDEPGRKKGVRSHKVQGKCYPQEGSKSVYVKGKRIVRHDDAFWMNAE